MYKDNFGNYYKYTNAPKEDPNYDPYAGDAIMLEDQPTMSNSPEYYDPKSMARLTMAIPQDAQDVIENEAYDELEPARIWFKSYTSAAGDSRFVYKETDVIENFDLWAAHTLRLTDSMITPLRRFSVNLFRQENIKDRVMAAILMLADQGMFEPSELVKLTVGDIEFIDKTVKIMGRKFVPDPDFLDFFSSVTSGRKPDESLFVLKTAYGERPIGVRHIYSVLKFLKLNSHALVSWHLSQAYTRIMSRLLANKMSFEDAEAKAFMELSGVLSSVSDVSVWVSGIVRTTVEGNYKLAEEARKDQESAQKKAFGGAQEEREPAPTEEPVEKSITASMSDDFGALPLFSGLSYKVPDEISFSSWLHSVPLHDTVIHGQMLELDEAGFTDQDPESEKPESNEEQKEAKSSKAPDFYQGSGVGGSDDQ